VTGCQQSRPSFAPRQRVTLAYQHDVVSDSHGRTQAIALRTANGVGTQHRPRSPRASQRLDFAAALQTTDPHCFVLQRPAPSDNTRDAGHWIAVHVRIVASPCHAEVLLVATAVRLSADTRKPAAAWHAMHVVGNCICLPDTTCHTGISPVFRDSIAQRNVICVGRSRGLDDVQFTSVVPRKCIESHRCDGLPRVQIDRCFALLPHRNAEVWLRNKASHDPGHGGNRKHAGGRHRKQLLIIPTLDCGRGT